MNNLNEILSAIVDETNFEFESREITYDGSSRRLPIQRVSASQLRAICSAEEERVLERSVWGHSPEASMLRLVEALRLALERFIDPETDRIGHAFVIEGSNYAMASTESNGLYEMEFSSSLREFAGALVQAAAIDGVETATRLLEGWVRDEPIRVRFSTVLNGLCLSPPVVPREDIEVIPLPLTTAELPRLPFGSRRSPLDYLGLTKVTLHLVANPALFRPDRERGQRTVHYASNGGIDFSLVCEVLSLQVDRYVDWSSFWHEYPDAASFRIAGPNPWAPGDPGPKPLYWKSLAPHKGTGGVTMTPYDNVIFQCMDREELCRLLGALQRADRKCRIAVERWRRSRREDIRLEDAYIELRIALESLYLKDFANEHSQEMRFRLALFGAWHLGEDLEERRSIRKTLRDAYDNASKAVHAGELPRAEARGLSKARNLCRRGILKLLHEGPPEDWGDLILGG